MKRIAYVEDEPDLRVLVQMALETLGGYKVDLYSSGPDALVGILAEVPDLVLLDVMLPGMHGPEVLRSLRDIPHLCRVPVVFITARGRPGTAENLVNLEGVLGVLKKPFDPAELVEKVKGYLGDE